MCRQIRPGVTYAGDGDFTVFYGESSAAFIFDDCPSFDCVDILRDTVGAAAWQRIGAHDAVLCNWITALFRRAIQLVDPRKVSVVICTQTLPTRGATVFCTESLTQKDGPGKGGGRLMNDLKP